MADDAERLLAEGHKVLYAKMGRPGGDAEDLAVVRAIRERVGRGPRLRLDPNEAWDPVRCKRMVHAIQEHGPIDFLEQPSTQTSLTQLAALRATLPCAVAADQCVFSPADALDAVRLGAADLIVLGLHETGGMLKFVKAAAIADAAGINVCLHGLYETGITTYAAMQAAATVPNLDDANQWMNDLLAFDIVSPRPIQVAGVAELPQLPGLGFELAAEAAAEAEARFRHEYGGAALTC